MFGIQRREDGSVALTGRCHAGHTEQMRQVLDDVAESCQVDFSELDYIASAGLGVLLATQKRLRNDDHALTLTNLNAHIREVFRISGFDNIFEIQ